MKPICQYHLKGQCRFGAKCRNSHQTPPPVLEECLKCKAKASLNARKLCQDCQRETCVLCLEKRSSSDSTTCKSCRNVVCDHCKRARRIPESRYCADCSLYCKGCNPSTPSFFRGPLCKNCQDWCPRCIEKKEKVLKHPGDKYCAKCLKDLCCGYRRRDRFSREAYCLSCRISKKCSIPCCNNTVSGERSTPCSSCQKIHDGLFSYYPREFSMTLKPEEISTKYSVRIRYSQLIQDHDGYCSDHYNDVDDCQILDVWMPLPSMLDGVADILMRNWSGEEEEQSDDEDYSWEYRKSKTSLETSFKSSIVNGMHDGKRHGPSLPDEYFFFYHVKESCVRGSGYCGMNTESTPFFIEILRL